MLNAETVIYYRSVPSRDHHNLEPKMSFGNLLSKKNEKKDEKAKVDTKEEKKVDTPSIACT